MLRKKRDVKEHILNRAKERFERFGFKKTTVDEICSDLKISKKTVYRFFKNKEDLFISLFIREALSAREEIFRRLGVVQDPLEKLMGLIRISIGYFTEETFMVKALKDTDGHYSPFMSEKYHSLVEEGILEIIMDILSTGIDEGKFRSVDLRLTSYLLFKIFQSFTYARTLPESAIDPEHEYKAIEEVIIRGIVYK